MNGSAKAKVRYIKLLTKKPVNKIYFDQPRR